MAIDTSPTMKHGKKSSKMKYSEEKENKKGKGNRLAMIFSKMGKKK